MNGSQLRIKHVSFEKLLSGSLRVFVPGTSRHKIGPAILVDVHHHASHFRWRVLALVRDAPKYQPIETRTSRCCRAAGR